MGTAGARFCSSHITFLNILPTMSKQWKH